MMIKLIKILFVCFILSASMAQAQNRMDDIKLHLHDKYEWHLEDKRFARDSTQRIQAWFVEDDQGKKKLGAIIASREKAAFNLSFGDLKEQTLRDEKEGQSITRLEDGKIDQQYPFALFNIHQEKERPNAPGSSLMILIETPTTIHTCYIRSIESTLSQTFITRWRDILTHPVITPSETKELHHTQVILSTPQPGALTDSTITRRIRESIQARLKTTYDRTLLPNDVTMQGGKITINLRGNVNKSTISNVLEKNASIRFLPLYQGPGYQTFIQKINSLIKDYQEEETPGNYALPQKPYPSYIASIPPQDQKTLLPRLNKFFKGEDMPGHLKLFPDFRAQSAAIYLYLANTKTTIIDEKNITGISTTFYAGKPTLRMQFDKKGKDKVASWTQNHAGTYLAVIADGEVITAPLISGPIPGGDLIISAGYSAAEMNDINNALQLSYPVPIKVESLKSVNKK